MQRFARLLWFIAVGITALGPARRTLAASPAGQLLQAIRLEQQADSERVTINVTQAAESDFWTIERARGRSHILSRRPDIKTELYLIDGTVYWRVNGGSWIKQPLMHPLAVPLKPAVLFTNQLTGVRAGPDEIVGGQAAKTYAGTISWVSGGRSCSGALSLAVSSATGLPALLRVKGNCESRPMTISESFEFGPSIHIEAP